MLKLYVAQTDGPEKDGSTSESSLESSSGYGSQTMPGAADDSNIHIEGKSRLSLCLLFEF